ncbi:unnamed protein product [Trichobilharzia szidati]|nr:unnamed protein product [Trichobilharzia szidati]
MHFGLKVKMADIDISKLGISKNLLQMNFMRRTVISKEKAVNKPSPDTPSNSQEPEFKLPSSVEEHIRKKALALESKNRYRFSESIFKMHNLPPGFRQSFGSFNPPNTSHSQTSNPTHSSNSICASLTGKNEALKSLERGSETSMRFRRLLNPKPNTSSKSRSTKRREKRRRQQWRKIMSSLQKDE